MTPEQAPAIANLQMNDLAAIERKASFVARRFSLLLGRQARFALDHRQSMQVRPDIMDQLIQSVVDVSLAAYTKSVWRCQIQKRRAIGKDINVHRDFIIAMSSPFDKEVKRIANQFDLDIGDIRKKLISTARNRVQLSVAEISSRVNKTLADITSQGLPTSEGKKILGQKFKTMGVSVENSSYVETLVRTHAQIAYSGAQWTTHQNDEDVWGFTYVTAGDDRVRPAHVKLDNLTLKKGHPRWKKIWPPNGWNCRRQAIAVYGSARESTRKNIEDPDEGFDFNPGMEFE